MQNLGQYVERIPILFLHLSNSTDLHFQGGKDLEQNHDFQKFLDRLKRRKDGDACAAAEVSNFINGQAGALGLIILSEALCDVEQNTVARLPQFEGAFLAIGKAGKQCKVSLIEGSYLCAVESLKFSNLFLILNFCFFSRL